MVSFSLEKEVIVVGDLHGDSIVLKKLLEGLGLENNSTAFTLNDDQLFVQMGDVLDRGSDGMKILEKFMILKARYGDHFEMLLGNHEYLNFIGDYRYVSSKELTKSYKEQLSSNDVRKTLSAPFGL